MPLTPSPWLRALCDGAARWEISTPARFAAFAGQLAHESNEFARLEENLKYSAARMMLVWPHRFPSLEFAQAYQFNAEKLANYVYADRDGNGSEASGDGYYFRGRGPIQTTFFDNYRKTGYAIGVDLISNPEKLLVPAIGIAAAGYYWHSHKLNELADVGDHRAITKAINGGELGLQQRIEWTNKILEALA